MCGQECEPELIILEQVRKDGSEEPIASMQTEEGVRIHNDGRDQKKIKMQNGYGRENISLPKRCAEKPYQQSVIAQENSEVLSMDSGAIEDY